jgi:hypothetical protein
LVGNFAHVRYEIDVSTRWERNFLIKLARH